MIKDIIKKKMYWLSEESIKKVEALAKKQGISGSKLLDKIIIPNLKK